MAHYVCVTGGRKFDDIDTVDEVLGFLAKFYGDELRVMHGAAPGADTLADRVARRRRIRLKAFPADWARHGKPAGFIRNAEMADYLVWCRDEHGHSVQVVAFRGGKGTANMVEQAESRGIPVDQV